MDNDTLRGSMKLFGSSGIRGLALVKITPDLAQKLGEVLGTIHNRVIIGHDPRTSGPLLVNAFTAGLLSTGCEVHLARMVSTPTLAHAARNFDCGVMVTASHNPPEYNGFKMVKAGAVPLVGDELGRIRDIASSVGAIPWREP